MEMKIGDKVRTWSIFHYGHIIKINDDKTVVIRYDAGGEETVPACICKK